MIPSHREARPATHRRPRPGLGCERLEGRELMTLAADIHTLVVDLVAIQKHSGVTPAEVLAFGKDLDAIAKVATKPSAASVATLKAEIKLIVANGPITPAEALALKKDVSAVLTSAGVPTSLAEQTAADAKAIVTSSGVTKADVKRIAGDVEAILDDLAALKK